MLVLQCYLERVPKEVDHPARRRELADAACRVIARNGLGGTTPAHLAAETGRSIGAIRYYFADKDELVASALWRVGERVDDRIRRRTGEGMAMSDLRIAATELLPLDDDRGEEALVTPAFRGRAAAAGAAGRPNRASGGDGRFACAPRRRGGGGAAAGATRRAAGSARHHT